MTNSKTIVLSALIVVGASLSAVADTDHNGGTDDTMETMTDMDMADGGAPMTDAPIGMGNMADGMDMMPMMQMMMQMHSSMMGGKSDLMGVMSGDSGQMGMMDQDMMAMMMPDSGQQNIAAHMGAQLRGFDSDQDGSLTLTEFETLHMSTQRTLMVDRFQHLDADGDGQITQAEMDAAGSRMDTMKAGTPFSDHHGDNQ